MTILEPIKMKRNKYNGTLHFRQRDEIINVITFKTNYKLHHKLIR